MNSFDDDVTDIYEYHQANWACIWNWKPGGQFVFQNSNPIITFQFLWKRILKVREVWHILWRKNYLKNHGPMNAWIHPRSRTGKLRVIWYRVYNCGVWFYHISIYRSIQTEDNVNRHKHIAGIEIWNNNKEKTGFMNILHEEHRTLISGFIEEDCGLDFRISVRQYINST